MSSRRWGVPAFQVYGRGAGEPRWHVIAVFITPRRDRASRWPLWRGTCITWAADRIAVGRDFAQELLTEQRLRPATCDAPVAVVGGRLRDADRRRAAGGSRWASASEVMAHECGHTAQARRMGWRYLPTGAAFTLFREGVGWVHRFENEASETGLFGGLVPGSLREELL